MGIPGTWRGVVGYYNNCSNEVKKYFEYLSTLIQNYPLDVTISYLFSRIELAHNMTIYCAAVKLHKVDWELAWEAINKQYITRKSFEDFCNAILGKNIKKDTITKIREAEEIRDRIMHGKTVTEKYKRKAIIDILNYAENFNSEVNTIAGFKPFGSLRGFKGRVKSLDRSTSRWILKGMGFNAFQ